MIERESSSEGQNACVETIESLLKRRDELCSFLVQSDKLTQVDVKKGYAEWTKINSLIQLAINKMPCVSVNGNGSEKNQTSVEVK